ncbi:MAG: DsbA family oxidoreductase [Gammaproteobacteria bacterium]
MKIPVSVWSDIACPWCFVGKAHLESAIQQLSVEEPAVQLQITWRAFELDPRPKEPSSLSYAERLATKYNRSVAQAQDMLDTMTNAIRDAGGHADFDTVIPANTFDAHRLIQWAGDTDRSGETSDAQHRITDAFMRGYLGEGLNLAKHEEMLEVVAALKLDRTAAEEVLSTQRYADVVRADELAAEQNNIRGVPFFVIGGYGLSGAQPSEALIEVIRQAQGKGSQT